MIKVYELKSIPWDYTRGDFLKKNVRTSDQHTELILGM